MTDHLDSPKAAAALQGALKRQYHPSTSPEEFLKGVQARARTMESPIGVATVRRSVAGRSRRYMEWGATAMGLTAAAAIVLSSQFLSGDAVRTTQEYVTAVGQVATIALSDGSTITLAPSSRLRYTAQETAGSNSQTSDTQRRDIELDGEAYFSVKHAGEVPFVVTSGSVVTTVLGTEFGIRKYADDAITRVTVVSGKVSSRNSQTPVVLTGGMLAFVGDSSVRTATVPDIKSYTGWVDGTLVFENVPADSMLTTLNRWYGYRFELADSALGKRRVTAAFDVRTPSRVLTALGVLLDVRVAVHDSVVTLIPGRVNQHHQPPAKRQSGDDIPVSMEVGR